MTRNKEKGKPVEIEAACKATSPPPKRRAIEISPSIDAQKIFWIFFIESEYIQFKKNTKKLSTLEHQKDGHNKPLIESFFATTFA